MDTWWDRVRLRMFSLFREDIIDLSQDKFTQGFSDGYKVGREHEKVEGDKKLADFMTDTEPVAKPFPIVVELEKVCTIGSNGWLYLNGTAINKKKLEQLKSEVTFFRNTLLWDILTNSMNFKAQEIGWNASKDIQDLMNGKMVSYTIQEQTKILNKIEKAR